MSTEERCLIHELNVQLLALRARRETGPWGAGEQWKWVQIRSKLREASELAEECLSRSSSDLADDWAVDREEHLAQRPLLSFCAMWMIVFQLARQSI